MVSGYKKKSILAYLKKIKTHIKKKIINGFAVHKELCKKKNYDQVAFLEETQMCYLSTATVIVSDSRFRS